MDEAGRGAVLGPLIVAGALVSQSQAERLWSLGARDSKAVARPRRKAILKKLWREGVRGKAVVIPPEKIEIQSLTALELSAMAELIRKLGPDEVVLDPPVGPRALPQFLQDLARLRGFPAKIYEPSQRPIKTTPLWQRLPFWPKWFAMVTFPFCAELTAISAGVIPARGRSRSSSGRE